MAIGNDKIPAHSQQTPAATCSAFRFYLEGKGDKTTGTERPGYSSAWINPADETTAVADQ